MLRSDINEEVKFKAKAVFEQQTFLDNRFLLTFINDSTGEILFEYHRVKAPEIKMDEEGEMSILVELPVSSLEIK